MEAEQVIFFFQLATLYLGSLQRLSFNVFLFDSFMRR